jgi:hypothetical protein
MRSDYDPNRIRAARLEAIGQHLWESYRGFPGDMTVPEDDWEALPGGDRQNWLADAETVLFIFEGAPHR